jgi:hypothetical protein
METTEPLILSSNPQERTITKKKRGRKRASDTKTLLLLSGMNANSHQTPKRNKYKEQKGVKRIVSYVCINTLRMKSSSTTCTTFIPKPPKL